MCVGGGGTQSGKSIPICINQNDPMLGGGRSISDLYFHKLLAKMNRKHVEHVMHNEGVWHQNTDKINDGHTESIGALQQI